MARYDSAKAVAAAAGLTPANYESGTAVRHRPRRSNVGKAGVRAVWYLPALMALCCGPAFPAFAQRLAKRGQAKPVIIGAVIRKLVHIASGVAKHGATYDPDKARGHTPAAAP
ncbi:MAG: transposase [Chloroflexales bacterium]|nr:transposase [Chloroflexales bacterium]